MIVFRKRLIFWLIKAYVKKSGKSIILFFLIGLMVFFFLRLTFGFFISKIPFGQKETVGMVGAYTLDNLPTTVLGDISSGLTSISSDGHPLPQIARRWEIKDEGKIYIFYLRNNVYFSDGTNLTSDSVNYKFSDVIIQRPEKYKIIFKLKETYSPFLLTVSRPILKNNFYGTGNYKIKEIKLNGNFVQSLALVSVKDKYRIKTYHFYPAYDSLKLAFVLGEVTKVVGLPDVEFNKTSFYSFPKAVIDKKENFRVLTTLFYNTKDPVLSDKKLRNGLSYALPNSFPEGKKALSLYSPSSWVYTEQFERLQDLPHARLLLSSSDSATKGAELNLKIKTLPRYEKTARAISESWKKIGVNTKIEIIETVPSNFQVFLGDFQIPNDPDQYMLWHSHQDDNITKYENQRIDKLLEDGRKTVDENARKKIYLDFQKYLLNDDPASFLYFPYEYEVVRK